MTVGARARLNAALAGRYRAERELGAGGMATVCLARPRAGRPHVLRFGRALRSARPSCISRAIVEIDPTVAGQRTTSWIFVRGRPFAPVPVSEAAQRLNAALEGRWLRPNRWEAIVEWERKRPPPREFEAQ
jgi:hypothetical protein